MINILKTNLNIYIIIYTDNTGQSILAKTKNIKIANKIKNKFKKDLKNKILLKPYKSAYKF